MSGVILSGKFVDFPIEGDLSGKFAIVSVEGDCRIELPEVDTDKLPTGTRVLAEAEFQKTDTGGYYLILTGNKPIAVLPPEPKETIPDKVAEMMKALDDFQKWLKGVKEGGLR
jgi:hypothetical protein